MALPCLYWMIECPRCKDRQVVHDQYLEWVGTSGKPAPPGAGYGGRPLPERYTCRKGCQGTLKEIGAIFSIKDNQDTHTGKPISQKQREEWIRLIAEAGLSGL